MQIILLRLRNRMSRRQSQVCFEEQSAQDVAQTLVGEVSFVERLHHPVIKQVDFRIEKLVVRIE